MTDKKILNDEELDKVAGGRSLNLENAACYDNPEDVVFKYDIGNEVTVRTIFLGSTITAKITKKGVFCEWVHELKWYPCYYLVGGLASDGWYSEAIIPHLAESSLTQTREKGCGGCQITER